MTEATEKEFVMQDLETLGVNMPDGLTISDDANLINWRGVNYIRQSPMTPAEDMTERQMLEELLTGARQIQADMAEFTSKISGNSFLSKIFGVKPDKG